MRVLLIKTSSMGDIIHTLPALTDAKKAIPEITFDWVVEDNFVDILRSHPAVNTIIPVALRRWRKGLFSRETREGLRQLRKTLQEHHYDLILDAQGLVKSAFLTFFATGERVGLDRESAREGLSSLAYQRKLKVNFYQHAILRMRQLFSLALHYPLPDSLPDYGLCRDQFQPQIQQDNYLVFLLGTTWASKKWPESYWISLAERAEQAGYKIVMSGNNTEELESAARIASHSQAVLVLPRLSISAMTKLLANAKAVVSVDTGFGHLAAALDIPIVSIYGSTNPLYTGALGKHSIHLAADFPCAPCLSRECQYKKPSAVTPACYTSVEPLRVWAALQALGIAI